ncbi:hypothetical protein PENSPDRAFT_648616 [Peniophora sp. CONT]|nr:hypothetical protein PENSPDRAFT_648616 [Peniophora sp. CONT]
MPPRNHPAHGSAPTASIGGPWRRGRGNGSASASTIMNRNPGSSRGGSRGTSSNAHGRRDFEYIASVSRSSGLDKDGDALKDPAIQVEYRAFVQGKLDAYWKRFPVGQRSSDTEVEKHRKEVEGNILIQLRKLREGISAMKRSDEFAVEVYETSLLLSLIFHSTGNLASISSHLIRNLYARSADKAVFWTVVLVQLQALADRGASQKQFYQARRDMLKNHSLDDALESWILGLARSLHRNEGVRFETLSRTSAALELLPKRPPTPEVGPDLAVAALEELLDDLREHARRSAWAVFRTSYREFGPSSRSWLARMLLFDIDSPAGSDAFDAWLARSEQQGEIAPKSGVESHWMVTKR